jgi:alkanesulfonate monooxygenase SsuD/methylene tetrahydromethanopterin reductase-like flavin-dependent oxidoreductase (luciferase family)
MPVGDPWIALSAIAMTTERLRLGPMVTAIPRRRPWKLAREVVSLDHLSRGRLILGVGAGSRDLEFESFGESLDLKTRARMLDEGLEILEGLFTGEKFRYEGRHYSVEDVSFLPRPVQNPRVPIWVAGIWPHRAPFRRAARWDGVFPLVQGRGPTPSETRDILGFVRDHRSKDGPFDLLASGATGGEERGAGPDEVAALEAAGATWWFERLHDDRGPFEQMRERVQRGPPRLRG